MKVLNFVDMIALVLVIVGGINWGLYGLHQLDLVAAIFGPMTMAAKAVYSLVGLAAIYCVYLLIRLSSVRGVAL